MVDKTTLPHLDDKICYFSCCATEPGTCCIVSCNALDVLCRLIVVRACTVVFNVKALKLFK
jgi:hypothetical protein